jgi:hypothetical protein
MMEFFLNRQGSFDEFLITDPTDCSVTNQYIGTGDGATSIFHMTRTLLSTVTEPVGAINAITQLTVGGTTQTAGTNYTLTGINGYSGSNAIQFAVPPAAGAGIYASFSYYFRVRFKDDQAQLENFMQSLWTWGQVDLTGIAS